MASHGQSFLKPCSLLGPLSKMVPCSVESASQVSSVATPLLQSPPSQVGFLWSGLLQKPPTALYLILLHGQMYCLTMLIQACYFCHKLLMSTEQRIKIKFLYVATWNQGTGDPFRNLSHWRDSYFLMAHHGSCPISSLLLPSILSVLLLHHTVCFTPASILCLTNFKCFFKAQSQVVTSMTSSSPEEVLHFWRLHSACQYLLNDWISLFVKCFYCFLHFNWLQQCSRLSFAGLLDP